MLTRALWFLKEESVQRRKERVTGGEMADGMWKTVECIGDGWLEWRRDAVEKPSQVTSASTLRHLNEGVDLCQEVVITQRQIVAPT